MSDTPKIDKANLPSRHVSVGPKSAPHRSYYYAMGMTEEEINQPLVGVVSTTKLPRVISHLPGKPSPQNEG